MLAQKLAGCRGQEADVTDRSTAPGRDDRSSRAARRKTRPRPRHSHRGAPCVRRSGSSETARSGAARGRPLLGKHHGDLALRRAVDARISPARLPAIQIRLRRLERLEAQPVQRRLLRVTDARFDFPLAIGIADATRQRDHAVMREHVAIERIERGIVDVRRQHALFQIVEDDDCVRCRRAGERRARAARPRSARSIATPAAAPTCASSRASRRRTACVGTSRCRARGPSALRRSRPGPPRRARS